MDKATIIKEHNKAVRSVPDADLIFEINDDKLTAPALRVMPHPEWVPEINTINSIHNTLGKSIDYADETFVAIATDFEEIVGTVNTYGNLIETNIRTEETIAADLNYINGNFTGAIVENLTVDDFEGEFTELNGVFYPPVSDDEEVALAIESITGNGYEGNQYALANETTFLQDLVSTDRENMIDNDITSYFEYSRIHSPNDGKTRPIEFKNFYEDLSCTVVLSSRKIFDQLIIDSDTKTLQIAFVETSTDGTNWITELVTEEEFNNVRASYRDTAVAYGTGIIDITPSTYVRIGFKNNTYDSHILGYEEEVAG